MSKPKRKIMSIAKACELFKAGRAFASKDGLIELDKNGKCLCHKEHVLLNHEAGTMVWGNEKTN